MKQMINSIPKADDNSDSPTCHKLMLAASACSSNDYHLSPDGINFKLPLLILGMIQGLPSPNEYIELMFPKAERINLRNLNYSTSTLHASDITIPIIHIRLSEYLRISETLDYAESVIKELTEAFEPMMPKESQLS